MIINIIYQGNNYNFSLREDVNIKYIKNLASKLISKDISIIELTYNNNLLSDYEETTLLKDLTKEDNNICIFITIKNKYINNSCDRQKKIKLKKEIKITKNTININSIKNILNSSLTSPSPINTKSKNSSQSMNLFQNKKNKISIEYISENKVFEDIYNIKENEIINLMKNLSQKIKEYDDILYKKYKKDSKRYTNDLSLYEKNIIEFKDKQIKFLKKLMSYFDASEKDFLSGLICLTEFINELKKYNRQKALIIYNNTECNKNKEINNINSLNNNTNNLSKNKAKIKLAESIFNRNQLDEQKLPLLSNNKVKNNRYNPTINNNIDNNNNNLKTINYNESKEKEKNIREKIFKEHKFKSETKNKNTANLIKANKRENLNKTENQEINSNIIFKENYIDNKNININKKNKNDFNIPISLCNTNDNTNTSQNTTTQKKNNNLNIFNKANESKKMLYNSVKRFSTLMNNNNKLKNKNKKMSSLFENPEFQTDGISLNSNSSELSDKGGFSNDNENENNKDLSKIEDSLIRNNKKKKTKLKKKMGYNAYDFII